MVPEQGGDHAASSVLRQEETSGWAVRQLPILRPASGFSEGIRAEFERQRREIAQIDAAVRRLDELREEAGMSKAELARAIGKEPSSIRRFFTANVNPELKTVAAVADILGAEVRVVAGGASGAKRLGKKRSPRAAG
ncbi:MAG TPA: helix-turn-helix transcriptional regulator [Solirubrobacterales bacterium]